MSLDWLAISASFFWALPLNLLPSSTDFIRFVASLSGT